MPDALLHPDRRNGSPSTFFERACRAAAVAGRLERERQPFATWVARERARRGCSATPWQPPDPEDWRDALAVAEQAPE